MKVLLMLSLVPLVIIAGCTKVETGETPSNTTQILPGTLEGIAPEITKESPSSAQITTGTSVEVVKSSEDATAPKTYQVVISEGLGIKEGSG